MGSKIKSQMRRLAGNEIRDEIDDILDRVDFCDTDFHYILSFYGAKCVRDLKTHNVAQFKSDLDFIRKSSECWGKCCRYLSANAYRGDKKIFQESQKFYISANLSGSNYLLVFCKIKSKTYSFMIDRKTLSFNSDQIKYENVNIMPVNIKLENSIFDGTIIDGIYIKHDKKKEKFFVITDLYMFRGVTTEKDKINMKLLNIETYLDYNMKSCQNLILTINKLYELENIDKLVNNDIKKTHDFHVRGLSFYPEI